MEFILPSEVEYIINRLSEAGYRADIVGGSVRDLLLGKLPDDYDITTDATPEEIKATFITDRTVDTGIKHGTVGIILLGRAYEVTTYRVDGEYKDARHPESVCFTRRIEEDLARRDFTVNAMAYSHSYGLTDPFGGQSDLKKKTIRAVGDPYLRFGEDALRILRGIRFASNLGFVIEKNTAEALIAKKELLKNVSAERIYTELKKTLSAPHAYPIVKEYAEVVSEIVPEISSLTLPSEELFKKSDYLTRLLSLFYLSCQNPKSCFESACRRLRTDTYTREVGARVISCVGKYDSSSIRSLTYALRDLGAENAVMLACLEILLGNWDNDALLHLNELIKSEACFKISDLALKGTDIMSLGAEGRAVGEILSALLTAVIDERVKNDREELILFAKSLI